MYIQNKPITVERKKHSHQCCVILWWQLHLLILTYTYEMSTHLHIPFFWVWIYWHCLFVLHNSCSSNIWQCIPLNMGCCYHIWLTKLENLQQYLTYSLGLLSHPSSLCWVVPGLRTLNNQRHPVGFHQVKLLISECHGYHQLCYVWLMQCLLL